MMGVCKCLANKSNLTLFDVSHQINLEVIVSVVADLFALYQEIRRTTSKAKSNPQLLLIMIYSLWSDSAHAPPAPTCGHRHLLSDLGELGAWTVGAVNSCCWWSFSYKVDHRLFLRFVISVWKQWFLTRYLSIFHCPTFHEPLERYQDCCKPEFVGFLGWK